MRHLRPLRLRPRAPRLAARTCCLCTPSLSMVSGVDPPRCVEQTTSSPSWRSAVPGSWSRKTWSGWYSLRKRGRHRRLPRRRSHSHITGLMRSGASSPEAQKLARHTDIKQTMKYTHIGIDDQAKAVGNLPVLHICCTSDGDERIPRRMLTQTHSRKTNNPRQKTRLRRFLSPPCLRVTHWRRRESNPRPVAFQRRPLRA